jgi:endoglucanase
MKKSFIVLLLFFTADYLNAQTAPVNSPVAIHGSLKTSGNKIVDKNNSVTSLAGMSYFWSQWSGQFYNAACVDWLVSDWNCQIVRAAMGVESGGYLAYPDVEKQKVFAVVDAAIKNGIYVLIDWHEENAVYHQSQAIAFFQEMATKYGSYPNVIYEIYNEPLDSYNWSTQIKPYSQAVVNAIRAIDPDNLIIIGNRNWDQHPVECANDQVIGTNLAYTLHFYVGTHFQTLRDEAKAALNLGIPLFVTEWGLWGSDAELDTWVSFMRDNNLSWCNWSINTKVEYSSALGPNASGTGNWPDADLTSIGYRVRDYIRGWAPKPCTTVRKAYTTMTIPGTIEAENYDIGCPGTSYYDTDGSNQGGKYRNDAVDIESCSDTSGMYNVGYIDNGEWLEYTISSVQSGKYSISCRVASSNSTATKSIDVYLDSLKIATVPIAYTGGWQTWQTVTINDISINGGTNKVLRLQAVGGLFNLNSVTFNQTLSTQTIALQKGWNIISTYVVPTDSSIATMFNGLDVAEIKTADSFWRKNQNQVFNTLTKITSRKAYLVNMNVAGTLIISGSSTQQTFQNPTGLKTGWNLVPSPGTSKTILQSDCPNAVLIKDLHSYWLPNGSGNLQFWDSNNGYFIKSN